MECNRDDAMRSRKVAETKFAMQDFLGAKKFILKAQQLYPPLEGAAQMLAVLEVHIAAQVKVGNNESDWYGILQVEPVSDDSTIKRQYRKLALLLHPDKNQAKGAEAAFKLIGEAFGVLSDKTKRYLHDSKRGAGLRVAQTASHASEPSKPANAVYQAQYRTAAVPATPATTGAQAPNSALAFWTACPVCLVRYQYMRIYLGYQLLCQKCDSIFLANDINAPAGLAHPVPRRVGKFNFQTWSQNGGSAAGSVPANGHAHAPGGARTAGAGNNPAGGTAGAGPATAAAAAKLVQRERVAAEKAELKRRAKGKEELERQEQVEAMKKARQDAKAQEALHRLRKKRDEVIEKEARRKAATKSGKRRRLEKRKRDDDDDEDEDEEELERSNSGCGSQGDITRKSSRCRRSVAYDPSDDDDFEVLPGAKKFRATTEFTEDGRQNASKASMDTNSVRHVGISSVSDGRVDKKKDEVNVAGEEETPEGESGEEHVAVPDSDFHDFDADRTEVHVKKGQVWAVFDETDGFPRFYCQINKVTRTPFYVEGVWLESIHPQKDNFRWLKDRELSIGTGQFRLGDDFQFDSINTFAHVMTFKKAKNVYEVYPKQLEVWAVYADYDKQVSSKDAEGNLKLRYDFVFIRSDFTAYTGQGRVVKLQKLKGYKTLWVPHGDDYALTVTYDLHKFSHRVPSLTVTEKDVQGVPCECVELDPASTPADVILN